MPITLYSIYHANDNEYIILKSLFIMIVCAGVHVCAQSCNCDHACHMWWTVKWPIEMMIICKISKSSNLMNKQSRIKSSSVTRTQDAI